MQVVREELEEVAAQESKPVTDTRMEVAILQAISDPASREILKLATAQGRSIEEMVQDIGLPQSTVYRRVHELGERGLLVVERVVVAHGGRRYLLYRSAFRGINLVLVSGVLRVRVTLNEDVADRFYRIWHAIKVG